MCSCVSVIFHYSIPVLSQEVQHKQQLPAVFKWAFIVSSTVYMVNGLLLGLYFGADARTQCNLNWQGYVGCAVPDANGQVWSSLWLFPVSHLLCSATSRRS